MFDIIRKKQFWEAWDNNVRKELGDRRFQLKVIQDSVVYDQLRNMEGKEVAEIGGGDSRILKCINQKNRCTNIEKFEGANNGPKSEIEIPNVKNVHVFLGEFSKDLLEESFDVVFSISVVEHVPLTALDDFFLDGMRILKPGGLWIHAIDLYVDDQPDEGAVSRFEIFRKWMTGGRLKPIGPVYEGPLAFSCDMATNPDDALYEWNQFAPKMKQTRMISQSVSILVAGHKN